MNKEPTFEEGPFFLTMGPYTGMRAIVWSTDETTAKNVFASKLNLSAAFCVTSYLGNLEDAKSALKLTPAQISDLHREGYLRL